MKELIDYILHSPDGLWLYVLLGLIVACLFTWLFVYLEDKDMKKQDSSI